MLKPSLAFPKPASKCSPSPSPLYCFPPQISLDPILFDPWLYTRLWRALSHIQTAGLYAVARIGARASAWPQASLQLSMSWQRGRRPVLWEPQLL